MDTSSGCSSFPFLCRTRRVVRCQEPSAPFVQRFHVPRPLADCAQHSRPTPDNRTPFRNVIDLGLQRVTLYYNCHYMTNICKNIENFKATARGKDLHPGTTIGASTYTYDFDSV